jgi:hypothetical protein
MIVEKQTTTADELYTLKIEFDDEIDNDFGFGLYDSNDDLVILSFTELEIYRLEAKEFRDKY